MVPNGTFRETVAEDYVTAADGSKVRLPKGQLDRAWTYDRRQWSHHERAERARVSSESVRACVRASVRACLGNVAYRRRHSWMRGRADMLDVDGAVVLLK